MAAVAIIAIENVYKTLNINFTLSHSVPGTPGNRKFDPERFSSWDVLVAVGTWNTQKGGIEPHCCF